MYYDCFLFVENGDVVDVLWLFGLMFTVVDIYLTVLLNRLILLGMDKYYFLLDQCFYIDSYFLQVKKRFIYIRLEKEILILRFILFWENLKVWSFFLVGVVGIGVVAGGVYLVY